MNFIALFGLSILLGVTVGVVVLLVEPLYNILFGDSDDNY